MTQHVAALICCRLVKSILMITCIDDQDISFTYFYSLFNVFWCINTKIFCHIRKVYYYARSTKLGKL